MAKFTAVTDTSPIIALAGIGELRLLDQLFERVFVPLDVWAELIDKSGAIEPSAVRALASVAFLPTPKPTAEVEMLDDGEAAAIALALSIPDSSIILDDFAARRIAKRLGLRVIGTLGILVQSKRSGHVVAVRPLIDRMLENGYRLAPALVESVLSTVGERKSL